MSVPFTEKSSGDSGAFVIPLNGHSVTLLNHAMIVQLSACIGDQIPLLKGNQWNREHFSSRAYLDEQGCTSLATDANFGVRATNEMIGNLVREFLTDVTIFDKFVSELPAARPKSPIGPMEWSQLGQATKSAPPWQDAAKPVPGLLKINRNISLKYDPDHWKQTAPGTDGQVALEHSSGDAHAIVIAERIQLPLGAVEDIALENAQTVDPKAEVVFRQQRRINGVDIRFAKIEARVNEVPMVYWGCSYGGEYGAVQVVTYAAKTLWAGYEKEFTDFLNGFMIAK